MKSTNEITEAQVNDFKSSFCPWGFMDCHAAVRAAEESGHGLDWAVEKIEQFSEECDVPLAKIDPVSVVYDSILQEARSEIEEVAHFDLCNDATKGEIYTAGNFMCTSYDYTEEAKNELVEVLANADVDICDLSENTQWFLDSCEISQDDINAIISIRNNSGE